MGALLTVPTGGIGFVFQSIARFVVWFYGTVIPFILQYIAIPMFALGILLAVAFAGSTIIFTILFLIFTYFFIKGTIFKSSPK
uniref:Uncharacterized protein n=1 Tax=viral metagenome TaxID=1070528 RepID=A0A6C0EYJ2_9ZZZZ